MAQPRLPLGGSIAALATPFADGALDETALSLLCERQVEAGTRALVLCASTGEAPALTPAEHARIIRIGVEAAHGRVPVIAGCSAPATAVAAELAGAASRAGAAALLAASPAYVKPTQRGIECHIRAIAHASDLPVILYDVPSRTGVAIADETMAALFAHGHIVALKDATADLARPPRLAALCGPDLVQLSGDDATAAAYRAAGGHGCISVTANLAPALCALLHGAWESGDLAAFARVRDLLAPLDRALFVESNPIPLKAALALLGLAREELRLPLTWAAPETRAALAEALAPVMRAEQALLARASYALAS